MSNIKTARGAELKQAFVAGFMATGEGYNGEYVGSDDPREVAEKRAEVWYCNHNFGEFRPVDRGADAVDIFDADCEYCSATKRRYEKPDETIESVYP